MSYCAIITFKEGKSDKQIEFRNAWGGAARIWTALFDKYLKDPNIPYHTWLTDKGQSDLWDLAKRKNLQMFERAVHASTFDRAYIRRPNFDRFCGDLKRFEDAYPAGQNVSHLLPWAEKIEVLDTDAVGFWGTSVSDNLWSYYNSETDETEPVPLSDGFEIYNWLDNQ